MADRLQLRRDTALNWSAIDPVLAQGEVGVDLTNRLFKVGDGVSTWSLLAFSGFSINDLASSLLSTYSSSKVDELLTGKADSVHTHATSEVTGLDTALDGKADSVHTHATSEVTGLDTALAGKADSVHTHATSEVTGLDTALAGKADSVHTHSILDITSLQSELTRIEQLAMAGL
jgi:hypothetical protein